MTLVAVGDSIVYAEDSWAAWLARAMSSDLHRAAANGARADDALDQVASLSDGGFEVACLSIGANDVLFDWDAAVYGERLGRIIGALGQVADHVLVATVSRSLAGFPGAGSGVRRRVDQANAAIAASGATVVAGDDLSGPRLLQPDRIHPTLDGQLLLADRAAAALSVSPPPSTLAEAVPAADRWTYRRVAAGQAPRNAIKRALRRPMYRDPRAEESLPTGDEGDGHGAQR